MHRLKLDFDQNMFLTFNIYFIERDRIRDVQFI